MSHNKKHSGSITQPLVKHTALLLAGLITTAFSTAHSPTGSDLQIFHIFITSPKTLIVHSILLQKSVKYARNKSGPNTLPWGTPDVTLTLLVATSYIEFYFYPFISMHYIQLCQILNCGSNENHNISHFSFSYIQFLHVSSNMLLIFLFFCTW
jgi:hypothetical protein